MDDSSSDVIEFGGSRMSPRRRRALAAGVVAVLVVAVVAVVAARRHGTVTTFASPMSSVAVVTVPTAVATEPTLSFTASYMDSLDTVGHVFSYGIVIEYPGSSGLDISHVQAVGRRSFTDLDVRLASPGSISLVSDVHHWPVGATSFHFATAGEAVVVLHGIFDCSQDPATISAAFVFTIGSSTQVIRPDDAWPQRLFDGMCR
jgi:hypothetical protein